MRAYAAIAYGILLSGGLACGGSLASNRAEAALPGEVVLDSGGELHRRPLRSLELRGEDVVVWGLTEVPQGARMQMAFAGADALARAELLKAVQVRVQEQLVDAVDSDTKTRQLVVTTVEQVSGVIHQAGPLPHGWERIRRDGRVIVRLWARLQVPRDKLAQALRAALAGVPQVDPGRVISGMVSEL